MYKEFSYVYDKLSEDIDYKKYSENIKKILSRENIRKEHVLELACGTGKLTKNLIDEFDYYDCLDISEEMLSVLENKLNDKKMRIFNMDMSEFKNPNSYDAIIILLDSINYILEKDKLEKLFKNSYKNLKEDGILIFDLNSPYKMNNIFGNEVYVYENEQVYYVWQNFLEDDIVEMNIDFFIKKDNFYERIIEDQRQKIYEINEIIEILKKACFTEIKLCDEDTFGKIKGDSLRILFEAKKVKK